MRKVIIYKNERTKEPGKFHYQRVPAGEGVFHQWGVDYEEFDQGPGNFSTAIVEMPDGTIETPPATMIEFIEPCSS